MQNRYSSIPIVTQTTSILNMQNRYLYHVCNILSLKVLLGLKVTLGRKCNFSERIETKNFGRYGVYECGPPPQNFVHSKCACMELVFSIANLT